MAFYRSGAPRRIPKPFIAAIEKGTATPKRSTRPIYFFETNEHVNAASKHEDTWTRTMHMHEGTAAITAAR